MGEQPISFTLYNRLTRYINHLKRLPADTINISATMIAESLGLNDVQVRKDLALVSAGGKPKVGYSVSSLALDLEKFLGWDNYSEAVLVGVGNLGKALLSYTNFETYGLKIVVAFDENVKIVGKEINGVKILHSHKIADLCKRMNIKIGIIAVPEGSAQEVCNMMIDGGIRAVWNFSPIHLDVPENVVMKQEDMAASVTLLTGMLRQNIEKYGIN